MTGRRLGMIGTGALWLAPLLAWWAARWSGHYRAEGLQLLALVGVMALPALLGTYLWLRQRRP